MGFLRSIIVGRDPGTGRQSIDGTTMLDDGAQGAIKSGSEATPTGQDEPIAHAAEDSEHEDFGELDWEQQKCLQWARIMEREWKKEPRIGDSPMSRFRESIACEREETVATLEVEALLNAEQRKKNKRRQATTHMPDSRLREFEAFDPGPSPMPSRRPHRPRSSGIYI